MARTYDQAIRDVRADLRRHVDHERLRALHRRSAWRHALVAVIPFALLIGGGAVAYGHGDRPAIWIPAAWLVGIAVFQLTTLLHEVLHGLATAKRRPRLRVLLAFLYAVPSGLSPTQFTRWHLDHHKWLGTDDRDPKRANLSPKRNARWLKALYLTPLLVPIYFRAARVAGASYPPATRRRIRFERFGAIAFHVAVFAALGPAAAVRVQLIPLLLVFPVVFTLNRLGQHYDVAPDDPLRWGTLMKPSPWGWDLLFLWSSYHLEHHLYPGVPCYRLPALRRALAPYLDRHDVPARTVPGLAWDWFVRNRAPHSDWTREAA